MTTIKQTYANQANLFWQAWQANLPKLISTTAIDFVNQANELLTQYIDGVAVELRGEVADSALSADSELHFTAYGVFEHFPKVIELVNHPIAKQYNAQAFRKPTAQFTTDFAIGMNGLELSVQDLEFALSVGRYFIDLEIIINKSVDDDTVQVVQHMAFILLDHILGEFDGMVKIGSVDFVATFSDDFALVSAQDLSATVNQLWRDELGRDDVYPSEYESQVAQVEPTDEQDGLIFIINSSANRLIGGELAWCVRVISEYDSQETLDISRDLEDELDVLFCQGNQAVNALMVNNMTQGQRILHCYCANPDDIVPKIEAIIAKYPLATAIDVEYDVRWGWYCL